jgi:hypothetical protein
VCLAGTLCLVTGGNRNLSDFQMIATDPCGLAQMVWTNDATGTGVTEHARQTGAASLYLNGCGGPLGGNGGGSSNNSVLSSVTRVNLPATGDDERRRELGSGALVLAAALLAYARRSPMRRTPRSRSSSPNA